MIPPLQVTWWCLQVAPSFLQILSMANISDIIDPVQASSAGRQSSQYVRWTSIIHQHSPGCIIYDEQSNDNCNVMWVMDSFSLFVGEWNSWLANPFWLWGSSRELDVLHYFEIRLLWLGRLSCQSPSYDNPYFSKWGTWWFFHLSLQLLIFMIPSNEVPQLSLSNEILDLLLQVITLVRVMPMISIEAIIFILIALIGISFHLLQPL